MLMINCIEQKKFASEIGDGGNTVQSYTEECLKLNNGSPRLEHFLNSEQDTIFKLQTLQQVRYRAVLEFHV